MASPAGSSRADRTAQSARPRSFIDLRAAGAIADLQHGLHMIRIDATALREAGPMETQSRCRSRARASVTAIDRSFISDGFCNPSSMTITLAFDEAASTASSGAVVRDDDGRMLHKQQRLVADIVGFVSGEIDAERGRAGARHNRVSGRTAFRHPLSEDLRWKSPSVSCRCRRV